MPTAGLSLVRENTEFIRPPRALWVPFDLGRPLGAPNDPAFQMEVVRAALALFERTGSRVILEDFPKDAPGQGAPENMEGMVCPVPLRKPDTSGQSGFQSVLMQAVRDEVAQLGPWHALFQETHNRSTVGVNKMPLSSTLDFLGELLDTGQSQSVPQGEWGRTLRFASEDLRNFYLEAAAMRPGGSASHAQLVEWFWGETSAAALLLALHPICLAGSDTELRRIAETLFIPRAQQHRL